MTAPIERGDYVVPDDKYAHIYTPCKVRAVYLNGKLRAVSDCGTVKRSGPISGFKKVEP